MVDNIVREHLQKIKKIIFIAFTVIVIGLLFSSCAPPEGKVSNTEISIQSTDKFSTAEINDAMNSVMDKFVEFTGCDLKKLQYDETRSDKIIESYMKTGKGSINDVSKENVIALISEFYVDSTGLDHGFNPNYTYEDWLWILIRDGKSDKWKIDGWGYY